MFDLPPGLTRSRSSLLVSSTIITALPADYPAWKSTSRLDGQDCVADEIDVRRAELGMIGQLERSRMDPVRYRENGSPESIRPEWLAGHIPPAQRPCFNFICEQHRGHPVPVRR